MIPQRSYASPLKAQACGRSFLFIPIFVLITGSLWAQPAPASSEPENTDSQAQQVDIDEASKAAASAKINDLYYQLDGSSRIKDEPTAEQTGHAKPVLHASSKLWWRIWLAGAGVAACFIVYLLMLWRSVRKGYKHAGRVSKREPLLEKSLQSRPLEAGTAFNRDQEEDRWKKHARSSSRGRHRRSAARPTEFLKKEGPIKPDFRPFRRPHSGAPFPGPPGHMPPPPPPYGPVLYHIPPGPMPQNAVFFTPAPFPYQPEQNTVELPEEQEAEVKQ
ncbi:MAG: hypothetical protein ACQKBW_11415 [Puniceicoccales bacterium]